MRLGAGRGDKTNLDQLQRVAEKAPGALGKKAEKLHKKFSKTVK